MDPATWSIIGVALCGFVLLITVIVVSRKKLSKLRRERVQSIIDAASSKRSPLKNAKPTSSVKYKPYLPSNLEEYDGLTPNGLVIYDANGHPYIVPIPEPVVQSFAVNSEKETDLFGGYQKNSGGDDIEVGGEQHASRRSSNFSGNDGRRPQSSSAASHYTPRVSTQSNRSMKIALGVFDGKSQLRPVGIQDRGSSQGDAPAYFIPVEILSLTPEKEDVQNPISPSSPTAIDNAAATESLQPTTANNNYNNQVSPISLTSQNLADSSALATRNLPSGLTALRAASEGNFQFHPHNSSELSFANDSAYETQARSEHSISKVYARGVVSVLRTSSDNLVYGAADRHHEDDIQEHSGGGSDEEEDDCENVRGEEGKDEELLPGAAAYVIGSEDDGDEQHDSASFIGEITQDHHCYAKNLMSCLKHSSDSLLYGNGNGGGGGGGGEVNAKQTGEGVGYARELVSCLRQSSDGKIYEEWSAEHAHQVKEEVEDHVNEALDCVAEKMYMYHISTKILPRKGGRMASTNPSESGMSEYHDAESGRSRNSVAGGSSRGSISVASAGSSVYMDTNA